MSSAITTAEPSRREGEPVRPLPWTGDDVSGANGGWPGAEANALLADAARLARQSLDADHACILLLDPLRRLVPVVAVARTDDPLLWSRFRTMPPVPLDKIPNAVWSPGDTRPIVVDDAAASDVIPAAWRTAFGVKSAVIAPLIVGGIPRGALVVGHTASRHAFGADETRLLEALAGPLRYVLGVADLVGEARRRDALLDRVAAAGRELCAARTRHAVLQAGLTAIADVLGGTYCAVHVVTDSGVDTLASRGARQPDPGPHPAGELDDETRRALRALASDPARPTVLPGRAGDRYVVVPMSDAGEPDRAFAVVGRDGPGPLSDAELGAARAVAAQAWEAYARVSESTRLARRVELLDAVRSLADDALLEPDMHRVLANLAPAVRAATGAEVLDAFLTDGQAARMFATSAPSRHVASQLRRWRRGDPAVPVVVDDELVVPMLVDAGVVGALRVRAEAPPDADVTGLLLAVAAGVGRTVARVLLRHRLAEHERALAVAEERERVGRDLHEALGQQLFALRVELEGIASIAGDRAAGARLREAVAAVTQANADLRMAVHALSFLEHAKRGLVPSLRTLVRKMSDTTPIGIQFRVVGTPVPLAHGAEEALFRVAHEALENVVRHSRASTATVTVSFSPERAALIVRDDGTGMSERSSEQRGLHFGLRTMQRRMEDIGGGLDVTNFRPHGVCLHAWVPTA